MYLSILVCVYNEHDKIGRCLESILNQSFTDFEVIVVNDGSYDGSGAICDEYAKKDSRVKVIHRRNHGLAASRKAALDICRGEYVGFVDSDDYADENMFKKLCSAAKENNADTVICGSVHHRGKSAQNIQGAKHFGVFDKKRLEDEIYPHMLSEKNFFEFGVTPSLWNKIFKREIIQCYFDVSDETVMGEDVAAVYPCLLKSNRVVILKDEFLYHYTVSSDSMTMSYKKWFFGSNRCVYKTLKNACTSEQFAVQIDYYVIYSSVVALKNEFSRENPRKFSEKLAGVIMYLLSDDVSRAFCNAKNYALPPYVRLLGKLIRKKKYVSLAFAIKLLNFIVNRKRV